MHVICSYIHIKRCQWVSDHQHYHYKHPIWKVNLRTRPAAIPLTWKKYCPRSVLHPCNDVLNCNCCRVKSLSFPTGRSCSFPFVSDVRDLPFWKRAFAIAHRCCRRHAERFRVNTVTRILPATRHCNARHQKQAWFLANSQGLLIIAKKWLKSTKHSDSPYRLMYSL